MGSNVTAAQLNDDCLGRGLDKISEYGVSRFLGMMTYKILQEQKLNLGRRHFDSTSLSLYGAYFGYEAEDFVPKQTTFYLVPNHGTIL